MNKISIVAGLGTLAFSASAMAQDHRSFHGSHGGDVTRQQALKRADQAFQRLDLNRDRRLTRAEAQQAHRQMAEHRPQRHAQQGGADNHTRGEHKYFERTFAKSGSVTRAAFRQQHLALFRRMDRDRNGVVTVAEQQQTRAQLEH